MLLFTVFLAPDEGFALSHRQKDGVVTHPDRTPFHFRQSEVARLTQEAGFTCEIRPDRLPRGQVLCIARPED